MPQSLELLSAVSRDRDGFPGFELLLQAHNPVRDELECVAPKQELRRRSVGRDQSQNCLCKFRRIAKLLAALFLTSLSDRIKQCVVIRNRSFRAGHFKALTGSSPMQYVKAMRLHEARLMIARQDSTIAEVALSVGYVSPAQFSRDFKRHFRRTASDEARWVRQHLGALAFGA
jgi:hypothetical protein